MKLFTKIKNKIDAQPIEEIRESGVILTDFQQASCLVSGFVSGFITVPALSVITIIIQAILRRLRRKSEPVDEWEQALKEGRRIK